MKLDKMLGYDKSRKGLNGLPVLVLKNKTYITSYEEITITRLNNYKLLIHYFNKKKKY